jgi:sec-independent protein translocase protein TatA
MPNFGPTELIIILVIIILLFGVGRIGKIAGEMGKGIRAFRNELSDNPKIQSEPDGTRTKDETY